MNINLPSVVSAGDGLDQEGSNAMARKQCKKKESENKQHTHPHTQQTPVCGQLYHHNTACRWLLTWAMLKSSVRLQWMP
jgi:hypothetical protein